MLYAVENNSIKKISFLCEPEKKQQHTFSKDAIKKKKLAVCFWRKQEELLTLCGVYLG